MARPDFDHLPQHEIEKIVVEKEDMAMLYYIDIWLERKKSAQFAALQTAKDANDGTKIAIKDTLSWAENLHTICKRRQEELKGHV